MKATKDPTETWHPFLYLLTEDDFLFISQQWPKEWISPPSGVAGIEKGTRTSGKDAKVEI